MEWKNPKPTVDVVIQVDDAIVLIRRRNPPVGWALPGGYVDDGERVEDAAVREALEETGLHVDLESLLYVYSDPARDPRQHTISVAFTARASGTPSAQDDAAEARLVSIDEVRAVVAQAAGAPLMVFDHREILADYLDYLDTGRSPRPKEHQG